MTKKQIASATKRLALEFGYSDLDMFLGNKPLIQSELGKTVGVQFEKIVKIALRGIKLSKKKAHKVKTHSRLDYYSAMLG